MSDLDAWLDDYQPYVSSTKVCGRADLIHQHSQADLALHAARASAEADDVLASSEVREAKRQVEELQAQIEASEKEFTFQGIGNQAWQDLKRQHPPTDVDRENGADCNMAQFAPALIAAASLDPKVSLTQAQRMLERFPPGEFEKLFQAALEANGQVIGAPKSGAAALIDLAHRNGGSSTTALPKGSRGRSSSAGNAARRTGSSRTKKPKS